ncbi:hypothetical protein WA026_008998 [Henosepilachna vigintioctopunctata]|uniref:Molybdenum cofactor sulfurase n=1 Tax=Henosepilachna vigintioctopunctata TaxID=420089 RepID=A0AAW1UV70_9CUCU
MEKFCAYNCVYSSEQEELILKEFSRIKNNHFLDHTGGTLYSEKQIANILEDLSSSIFCNPHGRNGPSQQTEDAIDILRYRILQHFHTNSEEYSVVFTANATASLKLVAENFDFSGRSDRTGTFVYLEDNHTSVLGLRNYCEKVKPLQVDKAFNIFNSNSKYTTEEYNGETNSLFVYPAQSNFSGTKYPLEWIKEVHNGRLNNALDQNSKKWYVVLDAASFASTDDLNLSEYKPDFVPISFYKIFGYPTGLGALLVKNTSEHVLRKKYYGGGTVLMALALENEAVLRNSISEKYEDGTIPYLSILSLNHGFETFERLKLSMPLISKHSFSLAKYVYRNLLTLHHSSGTPAVVLYHDTVFENNNHQGAIVNFNLLRENGEAIGYAEVMNMANLHNIHLRTGCSCNPGACQRHLKLTTNDVRRHFQAGHVCGDQNDLVDGLPTGSVRVSFGYMSRRSDADALIKMIEECFIKKPIIKKLPSNWDILQANYRNIFHPKYPNETIVKETKLEMNDTKERLIITEYSNSGYDGDEAVLGIIKHLLLYPIKSCGAFVPTESWRVTASGLKYDRKWMIVNSSGSCVTQKQFPHMCLIKPIIDLQVGIMKLTYPDEDSLSLQLHDPHRNTFRRCESKICRDRVIGFDCGNAAGQWLNKCLGAEGLRLVEQIDHDVARVNKNGENLELSFANQSQYLMVNLASVRWLRDRVQENEDDYAETLESMVLRFRPNIVIDFKEPFMENELDSIEAGTLKFKAVGSCTRCQMICINQVNAQKTKEPLITLGREFGGKVQFGIYLCNEHIDKGNSSIDVGSKVVGGKKKREK